jgi:hypothetical protein
LAGKPDAEVVLGRHADAPQTWQAPLEALLADSEAVRNPEVIEAAPTTWKGQGGLRAEAVVSSRHGVFVWLTFESVRPRDVKVSNRQPVDL